MICILHSDDKDRTKIEQKNLKVYTEFLLLVKNFFVIQVKFFLKLFTTDPVAFFLALIAPFNTVTLFSCV